MLWLDGAVQVMDDLVPNDPGRCGALPPGGCAATRVARLGRWVQPRAGQEWNRGEEPVPVTLDGHSGLYLELRVPSDIKPVVTPRRSGPH